MKIFFEPRISGFYRHGRDIFALYVRWSFIRPALVDQARKPVLADQTKQMDLFLIFYNIKAIVWKKIKIFLLSQLLDLNLINTLRI